MPCFAVMNTMSMQVKKFIDSKSVMVLLELCTNTSIFIKKLVNSQGANFEMLPISSWSPTCWPKCPYMAFLFILILSGSISKEPDANKSCDLKP